MRTPIHLRFPGGVAPRPVQDPATGTPRLTREDVLYMHVTSDAEAEREAPGLMYFELWRGSRLIRHGLVLPDDLSHHRRKAFRDYAAAHSVDTIVGRRGMEVLTYSEFFDPRHGLYTLHAYERQGPVVVADLLRFFGIMGERFVRRSEPHPREWRVFLPGWGKEHDRGRVKWASPHRPSLRIWAQRVGGAAVFDPCAPGYGARDRQNRERSGRGNHVDVLRWAYALTADRTGDFGELREDIGLSLHNLSTVLPVRTSSIARLVAHVAAIRETAKRLDEEGSRYFSTARSRVEEVTFVDPVRTASAAAIAAQIPARFGVRAPSLTFALNDDETRQVEGTLYGGRCDYAGVARGLSVPAVSYDMTLAHGLTAHLFGWWRYVIAERINRMDSTEMLRNLCSQVAANPSLALDPRVWEGFGVTVVEVVPRGEPWPVSIDTPSRPDGRLEVVPLTLAPSCARRTMHYMWPDVLAAVLASGRVPDIVGATTYVPVGRQSGLLETVDLLPDCRLDGRTDPVLALYHRIRLAKERRDESSARTQSGRPAPPRHLGPHLRQRVSLRRGPSQA